MKVSPNFIIAAMVSRDNNNTGGYLFLNYSSTLKSTLVKTTLSNI